MSGKTPFDFDKLWESVGPNDPSERFSGGSSGSTRETAGSTAATERLPSRVRIPQMELADGTLYRWWSEYGHYRLYRRGSHAWEEERSGDRAAAIGWAKELRAAGGTHPFKSVTQLVARGFPIVATIDKAEGHITEGGPGHCLVISTKYYFDAVAEVDDAVTLRAWTKQRGYGWVREEEEWSRTFPAPVSLASLRTAAENSKDQICIELMSYGESTDHLIDTLWSHFPWLF